MVEARLSREPAEERECSEGARDRNQQALADVLQTKVAELVRQHRLHFAVAEGLEQRVEEHDALVPADTGEVRVAVARAARAVDDEHAPRGEAAALEQRLD